MVAFGLYMLALVTTLISPGTDAPEGEDAETCKQSQIDAIVKALQRRSFPKGVKMPRSGTTQHRELNWPRSSGPFLFARRAQRSAHSGPDYSAWA